MAERKTRTKYDICEDLVISHLGMTDHNLQAEDLLQLRLDDRLDLSELV